jgi:hypothetical protein
MSERHNFCCPLQPRTLNLWTTCIAVAAGAQRVSCCEYYLFATVNRSRSSLTLFVCKTRGGVTAVANAKTGRCCRYVYLLRITLGEGQQPSARFVHGGGLAEDATPDHELTGLWPAGCQASWIEWLKH